VVEKKNLSNTDMKFKNKSKTEVHGNPGKWICACKAWNEQEGWMKSTKVMPLISGCLVQVSTQQGDNVAEAICYVPGAQIKHFTL